MDIECLKSIIKETHMNLKEGSMYKYKDMTDEDYSKVAENIFENDEFWNMLDKFILEELQNYEEE